MSGDLPKLALVGALVLVPACERARSPEPARAAPPSVTASALPAVEVRHEDASASASASAPLEVKVTFVR